MLYFQLFEHLEHTAYVMVLQVQLGHSLRS